MRAPPPLQPSAQRPDSLHPGPTVSARLRRSLAEIETSARQVHDDLHCQLFGRSDDPPGVLVAEGLVRSRGETDRPFHTWKGFGRVRNSCRLVTADAVSIGPCGHVHLQPPSVDVGIAWTAQGKHA